MSTRNNTPTCTHHCGACDQHFTSLGAFDSHRSSAENGRRYCRPANYVEGLEVAAVDGMCRLLGGPEPSTLRDVTVWREQMTDADRLRLAALRSGGSSLTAIQPENVETVRVAA